MVRASFHIIPVARIASREILVRRRGSFRRKELAVYCYLVRHPSKGNVLIDTGYPALTAIDPTRYPGFPASSLMKISMQQGDEVSTKIQKLGIQPKDIATVLCTHLHVDHMGDIKAFSSSKILVHAQEWDAAHRKGRRHGFRPDYLTSIVPETFVFDPSTPFGPFESSRDILGDGTIIAVPTPGHTPGHVSYLVDTGDRSFFITGDAAWVEENYRTPCRKGLLAHFLVEHNRTAQRDSLERIHTLYTNRKDIYFLAGHDSRILSHAHLAPYLVI